MAASRRCRLSRSGGVRERKNSPPRQGHPQLAPKFFFLKAAIRALRASRSSADSPPPGAPPPPAVSVTPVVSRQVTETIDYVGRLTAVDKVDIVARVPGFIEERKFKEGQYVKTGDLLFRIEQATYKAAVEQARATLAK